MTDSDVTDIEVIDSDVTDDVVTDGDVIEALPVSAADGDGEYVPQDE